MQCGGTEGLCGSQGPLVYTYMCYGVFCFGLSLIQSHGLNHGLPCWEGRAGLRGLPTCLLPPLSSPMPSGEELPLPVPTLTLPSSLNSCRCCSYAWNCSGEWWTAFRRSRAWSQFWQYCSAEQSFERWGRKSHDNKLSHKIFGNLCVLSQLEMLWEHLFLEHFVAPNFR